VSTILVVDDDIGICEVLGETLRSDGYDVITAVDGKMAIDILKRDSIDLAMIDVRLPRVDGMALLDWILKNRLPVQVVMISAHGTVGLAVEATRKGAFDFLEKPLQMDRVAITVRNALGQRQLEQEKRALFDELRERYHMVGSSKVMREVFRMVDRAAKTDTKVLITGESGTGKELVARAIHVNSARASRRFLAMNCASLPDQLIENELFGHRKGSFTHATADQKGKFELANGGTLFLDEIGDMSLNVQAKLLRALEEGEITPIGAEKPTPVDVRIIAATNRDLKTMVEQGMFREDLYYRLNVLHIEVPPLRERREDIPILFDYYVETFCETNKFPRKSFSPQAMGYLMAYSWPGNVRELRNVAEKLVVLYPDVHRFELHHVLECMGGTSTVVQDLSSTSRSLREARQAFEKRFIEQRLMANQWRIVQTAKELGIQRSHLWKKMKQYGIEVPRDVELEH